jgi:hypothetical protein
MTGPSDLPQPRRPGEEPPLPDEAVRDEHVARAREIGLTAEPSAAPGPGSWYLWGLAVLLLVAVLIGWLSYAG